MRKYCRDHIEILVDSGLKKDFLKIAKKLTGKPASHLVRFWMYTYVEQNRKKCVDISHDKIV